MPIHEYACADCAHVFEEILVRRSDEADVACKACGSRAVSRQMSRPAATPAGGSRGAPAPAPRCGPVG